MVAIQARGGCYREAWGGCYRGWGGCYIGWSGCYGVMGWLLKRPGVVAIEAWGG